MPIANHNATVGVSRSSSVIAAGAETFSPYAAVGGLTAVQALIEPMPARQQQTIFGTISQNIYWITWGTEAILDGDRITWGSRVFTFKYHMDDQNRVGTNMPAYQVGFLTEDAYTHS